MPAINMFSDAFEIHLVYISREHCRCYRWSCLSKRLFSQIQLLPMPSFKLFRLYSSTLILTISSSLEQQLQGYKWSLSTCFFTYKQVSPFEHLYSMFYISSTFVGHLTKYNSGCNRFIVEHNSDCNCLNPLGL